MRDGRGTFEAVHIRKNGTHVPVEMHIQLFKDGEQSFFINVCRDISERKQRELEYQSMVQATSDGFWIASATDARLLDANETYCKMVGYSREELLSMHIFELEANKTTEDHILKR